MSSPVGMGEVKQTIQVELLGLFQTLTEGEII